MKRPPWFLITAFLVLSLVLGWFDGVREKSKAVRELDLRATTLATSAGALLPELLSPGNEARLGRYLRRVAAGQPVAALVVCQNDRLAALTPDLPGADGLCDGHLAKVPRAGGNANANVQIGELSARVHGIEAATPPPGGTLWIVQDRGPLQVLFRNGFLHTFVLSLLGFGLVTALVASQIHAWLMRYALTLYRALRQSTAGKSVAERPEKGLPFSEDVGQITARILKLPLRSPFGSRLASPATDSTTPLLDRLKTYLQGREVVIFANREPYIHQKTDGKIKVLRPASGLVTALEPIVRNCGGLWIGHGSGNADRETANESGLINVPPGNPSYRLKRVWLTPEEEQGYYYGLSNEGLWPLCHLAHQRPTFRLSDWEQYQTVNRKFADALPAESLNEHTLMLVQDYHFALLPRLLREKSNAPRICLFWHIPWPNPEAFGICPWGRELLNGMLGADVVGFHTQYHCNNFLETCDRALEARIDRERFSVTVGGHETLVRAFPIGIDTSPVRTLDVPERQALRERYGIQAEIVAVGVDRLDYTKGIAERMLAVERFMEKHPEYVGRFTLVQMGSPSRTHIPAYRNLALEIEHTAQRINDRFAPGANGALPIQLLAQHHEWDEIQYFYQLGDLCLVTSLHDGMNLVAKEYVWCQAPERGVLILSKFAGASRELSEALLVNPYNIEEVADAIARGVTLPVAEKAARMNAMKGKISSHNAFHWATDLVRVLVEEVKPPGVLPFPRVAREVRAKTRP